MTTTEPLTEQEQQALEQMREAHWAGRTAALRTQKTLGAQGCFRSTPAPQGEEVPQGRRICSCACGACGTR
jgi:hypothetical protein